jgi:hypothetical protein
VDRRCATGPRGASAPVASDTSQGRAAIELHLTKLAEVKNRWDQAAAAATQILTA